MSLFRMLAASFAMAAQILCVSCAAAEQGAKVLPAPALDEPRSPTHGTETAILAGGCFWGMQGLFEHVKGVDQVVSGYSGGADNTAQYEDVSSGTTGHAESVKITFDPAVITYGEILRIYFSVAHDPTELNRQGPDSGTQYRSDVFYANSMQEKIAQAYLAQLAHSQAFSAPIVTRVDKFTAFYPAEAYHQDYLIHNPDSPYIVVNDLPKIANLKALYSQYYKDTPARLAVRGL
jgi:peptide-methionine (S)-S-oxide reductase